MTTPAGTVTTWPPLDAPKATEPRPAAKERAACGDLAAAGLRRIADRRAEIAAESRYLDTEEAGLRVIVMASGVTYGEAL